ncbi:hypothetical protein [Falsihalocynthiibacter arcticus]|uniref:Uncharacterized protein n=1 Tax=Falsihalocynthiibacter arcticus TaxID=1579316 RepID=A0A126UWD4_9RHOB|nr:hypothetical protein [Falsihalocynthiibacter arcticus]AML50187.1 hypothetical protein RC74_01915 [Falsihalocynthiibacter arcticus]
MANKLKPSPSRAIEFLRWLTSNAPMHLESMASQGNVKPNAQNFAPQNEVKAMAFVESGNSDNVQRNMYFLPNAEFLSGKRKKENLSTARFLHVDLDFKDYPGEETEQKDIVLSVLHDEKKRPKGIPLPTAMWFTGGGARRFGS